MKRVLEVCLVAVTLATGITAAAAQPSTTAAVPNLLATQTLQQGVSVNMAVTGTAASMPDADNPDAWIVAVTRNGGLYFGINAVTPDQLEEQMRIRPRSPERQLYIKADARVPYANLEKAFLAARASGFETPVLLTAQPQSAETGTIVTPKGLEVTVMLGPVAAAESGGVIVIHVIQSSQQEPVLTINHRQVPWANMQSVLGQLLQNRSDKLVQVTADGMLPFANVAHVIDVCHSVGAKVALVTPEA